MATASREPKDASDRRAVERTAELSDQVLEQVKDSQQKAIEAVRQFMESVDDALPPHAESPSKRQEVIDSALEMAESLVQTQYDFLRNVVRGAGQALGSSSSEE